MSALARAIERLAEVGLNATGVAGGAPYQAVLPGCRSVLVFGSGGTALWDAFLADLGRSPQHLSEELHPLDAFVRRAIERADPEPAPSRRWIRCSADEPHPVDFRTLAVESGLGWSSKLGLVLHPKFGPWLGLRAACFTVESLPSTGPLAGTGPCADCSAPCRPACPAGAVRDTWSVELCSRWNVDTTECASTCWSRMACPIGSEHRYSELQRRYHYDRKTGRRELRARLGIADPLEGVGPHWKQWT